MTYPPPLSLEADLDHSEACPRLYMVVGGGDSPSPVADWNPAGIHNSLPLSGRPARLLSLTDPASPILVDSSCRHPPTIQPSTFQSGRDQDQSHYYHFQLQRKA